MIGCHLDCRTLLRADGKNSMSSSPRRSPVHPVVSRSTAVAFATYRKARSGSRRTRSESKTHSNLTRIAIRARNAHNTTPLPEGCLWDLRRKARDCPPPPRSYDNATTRDEMTKRWQFWVLSVIGAAFALLTAGNMLLYSRNQTLQSAVNHRSQYIQQTVALQGLYRQIIQAVATLSIRDKDKQLQAILARQGLKVRLTPSVTPNSLSSPKNSVAHEDAHAGAHGHQ